MEFHLNITSSSRGYPCIMNHCPCCLATLTATVDDHSSSIASCCCKSCSVTVTVCNESWDRWPPRKRSRVRSLRNGTVSSHCCGAFGFQMQPLNDAALELRHSLNCKQCTFLSTSKQWLCRSCYNFQFTPNKPEIYYDCALVYICVCVL